MKPQNHYERCGYGSYFKYSINERINLRQDRNRLNINGLFRTVVTSPGGLNSNYPRINNGTYHHLGKQHSKYN